MSGRSKIGHAREETSLISLSINKVVELAGSLNAATGAQCEVNRNRFQAPMQAKVRPMAISTFLDRDYNLRAPDAVCSAPTIAEAAEVQVRESHG
jgi:hypothetical protein